MISLRHDLCMNHKLVSLSSSFMVLGQTPHEPPQQGERRDTVRSLSLSAVQCKSIQFNPFWFSPRNILLLLFSRSVVSDSLRPHGPQHPGFSVLHHLLEFAQCLLSRWCHPTILSFVVPFSFFPQSFLSSRSFLMSWLFTSGGQSIEASPSVLPMNMHWFPLGWTGLISLLSKGLLRVFSNTTVQKHQFFGTQLSLWSNSHIHTWLLEKP